MTPNLTPSTPELDRLVRQTPAGMMYWSGTCPDPSATCGDCRHYGYETATRNEAGNVVDTCEYPFCCALYKKHTVHRGEMVHRLTPACKYFEPRQQPELAPPATRRQRARTK